MSPQLQRSAEVTVVSSLGLVMVLAENLDMVTRLVGTLAVVLGLFYTTMRFIWEWEDRRKRDRAAAAPPVPAWPRPTERTS